MGKQVKEAKDKQVKQVKEVKEAKEEPKPHKNTKANRLDQPGEILEDDKHTWPSVVLPSPRMRSSTSAISLTGSRRSS